MSDPLNSDFPPPTTKHQLIQYQFRAQTIFEIVSLFKMLFNHFQKKYGNPNESWYHANWMRDLIFLDFPGTLQGILDKGLLDHLRHLVLYFYTHHDFKEPYTVEKETKYRSHIYKSSFEIPTREGKISFHYYTYFTRQNDGQFHHVHLNIDLVCSTKRISDATVEELMSVLPDNGILIYDEQRTVYDRITVLLSDYQKQHTTNS